MSAVYLPVLSCTGFAASEASWLKKNRRQEHVLMQRAVAGIVEATLIQLGRKPKVVLVLAGKGKNGADAILAGCALGGKLFILLAEGEPVGELPKAALAKARRKGACILTWQNKTPTLPEPTVILDGILGTGFRGILGPELRRLLKWSESIPGLRVAVDVPSGVSDRHHSPCFRADLTVSIGCLKAPLLLPAVAKSAGRIRVVDIKIPLKAGDQRCATRNVLGRLTLPRDARTEKREQGRVFIVGGSRTMPGAVIMNTEAALRSGAGLVTALVPSAIQAKAALMLPEAMWVPLKPDQTKLPTEVGALASRADTVLVGSGLGTKGITLASSTARAIRGIAILDADALNSKVIRDTRRATQRILLPHAGEFLRITGKRATPEAAHLAAQKLRAIIVLKGPLTVVADGESLTYIPFGGPVLARGGSGDLLAGIVASIVARRKILKMTPLQATIAAVTWHALAADWLTQHKGETAVRTTQMLDGLSPTLRRA
jgi:NAD(P)H-hydrate epimerase